MNPTTLETINNNHEILELVHQLVNEHNVPAREAANIVLKARNIGRDAALKLTVQIAEGLSIGINTQEVQDAKA